MMQKPYQTKDNVDSEGVSYKISLKYGIGNYPLTFDNVVKKEDLKSLDSGPILLEKDRYPYH
jgi:hypothetical protein